MSPLSPLSRPPEGASRRLFLSVGLALLAAPPASAYLIECNDVQLTSPTISGVLGEPRDTDETKPTRLHSGVDTNYPQCRGGQFVQAISTGVVSYSPNCTTATKNQCRRVTESNGHAFDYIHFVEGTMPSTGSTVAKGDDMGQLLNSWNHLHLNDVEPGFWGNPQSQFRVNPQLPGHLTYAQATGPVFVSTSIDTLTDQKVTLIQESTGPLADGDYDPVPFNLVGSTFFIRGSVDVLVSVAQSTLPVGVNVVGWSRSGAGPSIEQWPLQFMTIIDVDRTDAAIQKDARTIYLKRLSNGYTYFATNEKLNWTSAGEARDLTWDTTDGDTPNGLYSVCGIAISVPGGERRKKTYCVPAYVDNSVPMKSIYGNGILIADGGATNQTSIVVSATDTYGLWKFVLSGPTTATQTVSGTTADYTFTSLTANATTPYNVAVYDLAGNVTSGEFTVDTDPPPGPSIRSDADLPASSVVPSTVSPNVAATDPGSGICSLVHQPPSGPASTRTFSGAASQLWGSFPGLSQGSHTFKAVDCAGNESSTTIYYLASGAAPITICASSDTVSACTPNAGPSAESIRTCPFVVGVGCSGTGCSVSALIDMAYLTVDGTPFNDSDGANNRLLYRTSPARTLPFAITNTGSSTPTFSVAPFFELACNPPFYTSDVSGFGPTSLEPGETINGMVTVADVGQTIATSTTSFSYASRLKGLFAAVAGCAGEVVQAARQGLAQFGGCRNLFGSEFYINQAGTMTYTAVDPGGLPTLATSTLKLYGWTGSSWTLTNITQLGVSKSTSTGVVIASAVIAQSGLYAAFFDVVDASAPLTSWAVDGSSSAFAGTTFVSTYSYLVLSATDPVVDGFHSGLATTYYRIDGLPGDAFAAYSSSLSFLPGTHWVDYYAVDWAGNAEGVKRATITVTAGSVTKLSGDLQVDGNLLVGFLGSGAKAEVVARAEYDYALMVSSVDRRAMLAVDNANFASIGTAPASGRLTLEGVAGDAALALRSGNSTAAVTGAQLAFGYDGTSDLRHALYTQHGAAAYNNKLVFKLWTPATGSSSTLGNLPVLSLEGSSKTAHGALVHVMPVGLAENELVVSNGVGLGLGNVLRWERWQPSAAELKTGIERLGPKDEQAAWADVMALKPARYRRKVPGPDGRLRADPAAPLERGYIFEEIPESVRAGQGGISVDERLVNAELALKAAIRQMNGLEERLRTLKAAKE